MDIQPSSTIHSEIIFSKKCSNICAVYNKNPSILEVYIVYMYKLKSTHDSTFTTFVSKEMSFVGDRFPEKITAKN